MRLRVYLSLTIAMVGSLGLADVADEYEKYVDQAIPLTLETARHRARVQEFSVFTDRLSDLSTEVAEMSIAAEGLQRYVPALDLPASGDLCPRRNGRIDVRKLLDQRFTVSQCLAYGDDLARHLSAFRDKRAAMGQACKASEAFESYRAEQLDLPLMSPPTVEVLDGTNAKVGDPITAAVSLVTSSYQSFVNLIQRERIASAYEKLHSQKVNTTQYRKYAQESCHALQKEHHAVFDGLETLADNYEEVLCVFDDEPLRSYGKRLDGCVARYEQETIDELRREALAGLQADSESARLARSLGAKRELVRAVETLVMAPGEDLESEAAARSALARYKLLTPAERSAAADRGFGELLRRRHAERLR